MKMSDDIKYVIFGILLIILSNSLIIYLCPMFGCHDLTLINIFKGNLICNVCTNMSYNIQHYQMQIYFAVGGCMIKKMNDVVEIVINKH